MVGLREKLVLVKGTGENGSFATSDFRKLSYNSVLFFLYIFSYLSHVRQRDSQD